MSTLIAKRIVLRLDPAQLHDAALARALDFATAFHAELAARMVADTRLATALAVSGAKASDGMETQLRRAESGFRRTLSALVAGRQMAWSFDVVHCEGVLAQQSGAAPDDLIALELPRIEPSMAEFRRGIEDALAHARGVLLFPGAMEAPRGPVVAIIAHASPPALVETSGEIAKALGLPLRVIEHNGTPDQAERREVSDIATTVRRTRAALAVIEAGDPVATALLARPRYLREMAAPLLLLKT